MHYLAFAAKRQPLRKVNIGRQDTNPMKMKNRSGHVMLSLAKLDSAQSLAEHDITGSVQLILRFQSYIGNLN